MNQETLTSQWISATIHLFTVSDSGLITNHSFIFILYCVICYSAPLPSLHERNTPVNKEGMNDGMTMLQVSPAVTSYCLIPARIAGAASMSP
jgi:hypothetical protein